MSRNNFLVFLFVFFVGQLSAQGDQILIVDIEFSGNEKTKEKVLERELDFYIGDSIYISEIPQRFEENKLRILGTGLFNNVSINLKNLSATEHTAVVEIIVEENWYLFPVPIFELADRNFSVWWTEQGKRLDRVNYGFRLGHYNFSGNRDPLKVKVHYGYTRKYELTYAYPYLAFDNKVGIAASVFYSDNREIAYKTIGNKTLFESHPDERKLLSRFRLGPEIKYRPNQYLFHSLRLEYHHNQVDSYVSEELNPDYFFPGVSGLKFMYLEYDFNFDKRLYSNFPYAGFLFFANIKKEGLGFFNEYDNFSLTLGFEQHHKTNNIILGTRNKVKTNLNRNPVAFANNTGLGWDRDIVGGYELYVMDGTDYAISMNNIKWLFFNQNLNTVKWVPRQFRKMHATLFLRFNFDFAYVNERTYVDTNRLNNRLIYGFGPALDLILFNNFLFSFEYSFNDIGERGLYFHNSFAF